MNKFGGQAADTGHWRGSNDLLEIPGGNCLRALPAKAPLPKGRCATAVNAHGGFLRIVTSLTRPVSALHAKAPLPKGAGTPEA